MKLVDILPLESIRIDLKSTGKSAVLTELSQMLANGHQELNVDTVSKILADREQLATTGIGDGVAIPHGKQDGLGAICVAVGIAKAGVPFDAVDGQPVSIFIALLAPLSASGDHLRALARISRLLKDTVVRGRLLEARTEKDVYDIICEEDGKY